VININKSPPNPKAAPLKPFGLINKPFMELARAKSVAAIIRTNVIIIAELIRPALSENQIPRVGTIPSKPAKPAAPSAISRGFFIAV
jgi:hypothetical protein